MPTEVVTDPADLEHVTNHWWWRPGSRVGRRSYACHLALRDADAVCDLSQHYQQALESVGGFDLIPRQWQHLTMQGLGFADEISDDDLAAAVDSIAARLATIDPITLTFTGPAIYAEAVALSVHPADDARRLRATIQAGVADAWGPDRVRKAGVHYRPHSSIGYVNTEAPVQPIREALQRLEPRTARVTVETVPVIEMHRDNRMYEWREITHLPIGARKSQSADAAADRAS